MKTLVAPLACLVLFPSLLVTRSICSQAPAGVLETREVPSQKAIRDVGGTSWQLVKFVGGDDQTLAPEDKSKYTIAFESDGTVSVRIDCNRGHGTWKSIESNQLEFGSMAITQAMCLPGPLNDRLAKDLQHVRSYVLKDGHLFLSLMADGGTYEFEPLTSEGATAGHVRGTATYRERIALPPNAIFEATLEESARADARAEVVASTRVEHPGNPPIAFEIKFNPAKIKANGAYSVRARIIVGDQLMFTTTQSYPVLTRNHGNQVKILLHRTSGRVTSGTAQRATPVDLPASFADRDEIDLITNARAISAK